MIYGEACEIWVAATYPCPFCGDELQRLATNARSVDHVCKGCGEQYQVKATSRILQTRHGQVKCMGASLPATLASVDTETNTMMWNLIIIETTRRVMRLREWQ